MAKKDKQTNKWGKGQMVQADQSIHALLAYPIKPTMKIGVKLVIDKEPFDVSILERLIDLAESYELDIEIKLDAEWDSDYSAMKVYPPPKKETVPATPPTAPEEENHDERARRLLEENGGE